MKTMILDTSSNYLYLYLNNDEKKYEIILEGKNNHSENLIPLIEKGLKELKMEVMDLDRIICGIGPGSYTGLRVGVTVCKIFAWTTKIPLYTINSLDILGSGYLKNNGIYAICNSAKKDYLYAKIIKVANGKITIKQDDSFVNEEEFLNSLDSNITVVNEKSFLFDNEMIMKMATNKVNDIHNLVPNYLRKANS